MLHNCAKLLTFATSLRSYELWAINYERYDTPQYVSHGLTLITHNL